MAADLDRYEHWYSERLWGLMPAVYRAADSVVFEEQGPLRELIDRIGAQIAIVRRSIDQLWDDQSIETCDDWVVPYIADLVAATLFSGLDARGQRLQVAKAIYYRRRAGTVAILEEAAHDITGWETRVVEFFHNLARTRHQLDMPIGFRAYVFNPDLDLQAAERLVGPLTRTPAGGWADLRSAYGASRAHGPFDDMAHTGEMRRGVDRTGWYNIPRLGIFVWRLHAFPEIGDLGTLLSDPVADPLKPHCFTFDPTGREVPLFATTSRTGESYGSRWITPEQWQLPGPVDRLLFDLEKPPDAIPHLYAHAATSGAFEEASVGVFRLDATSLVPLAILNVSPPRPHFITNLLLRPEWGRFWSLDPATLRVFYHYGSPGRIGAGAYDRRLVTREVAATPGAETTVHGGAGALASNLAALPATATLTLTDSLTYSSAHDIGPVVDVTLRAAQGTRPLLRIAPPVQWRITGAPNASLPPASLRLEGLFLSGPDLVLDGDFAEVDISFSTLDPGSAGDPAAVVPFRQAIDGQALRPTHIWIDGHVNTLRIASSITGPIRTRGTGQIEHLVIDRSILQSHGFSLTFDDAAIALAAGDVTITRSTILGKASVHRIDVSESILHDVVTTEDPQHGCVRFSSWVSGSVLPRKYESVEVAPRAEIFTSTDFGQPGYGQLLRNADQVIPAPAPGSLDPPKSIREGAENGSEQGAFYDEINAIRERSLLLKLQELMPLGLIPVIVPVT